MCEQISLMIKSFFENLNNNLIFSIAQSQNKNSLNITLNQECTRAAHFTIECYLKRLAQEVL